MNAYKNAFDKLKGDFDVLAAFCMAGGEQLALQRSTQGVGIGIDKKNTGAQPSTQEVADEVGRPMAAQGGGGHGASPGPPSPGGHRRLETHRRWAHSIRR